MGRQMSNLILHRKLRLASYIVAVNVTALSIQAIPKKAFIVQDGDASNFKTCQKCAEARDWLLNETDWPDDIDGEGHSYFFTMLRDHLREQGRKEGDRKYAFRAYRLVVLMDKRRMAYANAYNAETVKIRDSLDQGVSA
jgi:hypothetical protein